MSMGKERDSGEEAVPHLRKHRGRNSVETWVNDCPGKAPSLFEERRGLCAFPHTREMKSFVSFEEGAVSLSTDAF